MAIVKFTAIFIIIITLILLGVDLGLSLLIGIISLVIFFKIPPLVALKLFVTHSLKTDTIRLLLIVFFIITLGEAMRRAGYFRRMLISLSSLFKDRRLVLIIPPALIGLLPMPAGAMVSAPIVEEVGSEMNLQAEAKHLINYWFRHLWEYSWPLYQGLVVASFLTGISISKLSAFQSPMILIALFVGVVFLILKIKTKKEGKRDTGNPLDFFISLSPIIAIFVFVLILKIDLLLVLTVIVPLFIVVSRMKLKDIKYSLLKGLNPRTLFLLLMVMVFKGFLIDTGILESLAKVLEEALPIYIPLFILPFIVALLTGVNIAYISITFPILSPLMGHNLALISFAYISGFMGILLSPTHLCLALTIDYFGVKRTRLYRNLLPMVLFLYIIGIIYLRIRGL